MDLPPVPLWLVKSPAWHMKFGMTRSVRQENETKFRTFVVKCEIVNYNQIYLRKMDPL